ncbi:MAG: hypothetical protein ACR2O2_11295 [Ruegeria sp.]
MKSLWRKIRQILPAPRRDRQGYLRHTDLVTLPDYVLRDLGTYEEVKQTRNRF